MNNARMTREALTKRRNILKNAIAARIRRLRQEGADARSIRKLREALDLLGSDEVRSTDWARVTHLNERISRSAWILSSSDAAFTVNASDALHAIRSGLTDIELMQRFRLSATGVQSLFDKLIQGGLITRKELQKRYGLLADSVMFRIEDGELLPPPAEKPRIRIDVMEAVNAVRSGLDDAAIMRRFNLSSRGLQSLFRKLVQQGRLDGRFLETGRSTASGSAASADDDEGSSADGFTSLDVVESLIAGMDRDDIKRRYSVSDEELDELALCFVPEDSTPELEIKGKGETAPVIFRIKKRSSDEVLFVEEAPSLKSAVESAIRAGVDLSGADLSGAYLAGSDLSGVRLSRADLSGAIMVGADLSRALMDRADVVSAEFRGANLSGADFSRSNLSESNLVMVYAVDAGLNRADLSECNFTKANLTRADLSMATLFQTILTDADLSDADLTGVDMSLAVGVPR
ncbi:MAG: pentapeptide repeat-containing protein [Pseudomonadota bacterium]